MILSKLRSLRRNAQFPLKKTTRCAQPQETFGSSSWKTVALVESARPLKVR